MKRGAITAPFITDADLAELELWSYLVCDGADRHKPHCRECTELGYARSNCAPLNEVFAALIAWWELRMMCSKAEWLRAREAARVWLVDAKLAALAAIEKRQAA